MKTKSYIAPDKVTVINFRPLTLNDNYYFEEGQEKITKWFGLYQVQPFKKRGWHEKMSFHSWRAETFEKLAEQQGLTIKNGQLYYKAYVKLHLVDGGYHTTYFETNEEALKFRDQFLKSNKFLSK